ncbi:MAG: methyltransferase domain-containing protein [Burkholderiaceae bacterium]|jgi:demethylmenaquinone methyltransferase/2-methoxy-6-polyprenyl-1,4-benzoquinol methylase|nr:methyltransferase domain-containing protein [Burkholderiaceae bacterium]
MHDGAAAADAVTRVRSIAKYRRRAAGYDDTCGPTWTIRERTIAALALSPGDCVLDVGCGTGLSLPLLRAQVGDEGAVFGFDQSPDMLAQARARVAAAGWRNVQVIESAAQALALPPPLARPVDALLFHYTHDILRSPSAVARLLSRARPGARVAIAGIKYFPWYLAPLNPWVYWKNAGYNGAPGGLRAPWSIIAARLTGWQMTPTQFGMGYIGHGRLPDAVAAPRRAPR